MNPTEPTDRFTVLVVAKAPVPGLAKTRLAAAIGEQAAADIAAAALLDTLDAVATSSARTRVVALTGNLDDSLRRQETSAALENFIVITQRGTGLADRLINAHADTGAMSPDPIVQIGMDTPQVTPKLLSRAANELCSSAATAVLGPAYDGGWWILGVQHPQDAAAIADIPTSRPDTGARTQTALTHAGLRLSLMPPLRDVDHADDLEPVAALCAPRSRFRAAVQTLSAQRTPDEDRRNAPR